MFSADPALADPGSDATRRHAGYATALAARRGDAALHVVAPGASAPPGTWDAATAQNPWCLRAHRPGLPFLAQLHFDPFAPAMAARAALARLALARAARVRVMAPATAEALAARWGIPPARIWVAPVPVVLPVLPRAREPGLVIGALRFVRHRAPLDWIAAARAIAAAHPAARFVLAGDGPLLAGAREAAAGLPIDLPGALDPPALGALLARAEIFLHAAPHDAFGRAMAEAQAAGVPVVARRTTGAAAVLHHGRTGLLADDTAGLVAAALALLRDTAHAAAMGAAAADGRFDPAIMTARVIDFLLGERP